MKYVVRIVGEGELPSGYDMVIVERGEGEASVMLVSGRPAEVWKAMRALEDTREPCEMPTLLYAV